MNVIAVLVPNHLFPHLFSDVASHGGDIWIKYCWFIEATLCYGCNRNLCLALWQFVIVWTDGPEFVWNAQCRSCYVSKLLTSRGITWLHRNCWFGEQGVSGACGGWDEGMSVNYENERWCYIPRTLWTVKVKSEIGVCISRVVLLSSSATEWEFWGRKQENVKKSHNKAL